ncbi:LytR/AlgR family response regulator transcription factor [Dyadobacter psychrotolerans]|uniref:LytTR family transcriptional regulator n=1 Tax=Dyadobacter psychrotolerans TaxID=2541721 RepID=A0A4R5DP25_9BACT|nr:LytTR family DNA-binding domain-containing protein [Dyadobacter psychrotolerans]TDE13880.1 LytTR family transcriptional regulator [Dyadobacter psychrotolerans]
METTSSIQIGAKLIVNPEDVILLIADGNYTSIHLLSGSRILVPVTLKELEKRFVCCGIFFRTHKSYLVNLHYIIHYDTKSGKALLEMKSKSEIVISRRKKASFVQKLSAITSK